MGRRRICAIHGHHNLDTSLDHCLGGGIRYPCRGRVRALRGYSPRQIREACRPRLAVSLTGKPAGVDSAEARRYRPVCGRRIRGVQGYFRPDSGD